MLVTLCACATGRIPTAGTVPPPPRPEPVDTACLAFGPITYSKADTDETIEQVRRFDAAWRALCAEGTPTP
jgi:hypothetical protein